MEACAKMQKQRKIYDASKARVKGTEMEKYVGRPKAETASKEKVRPVDPQHISFSILNTDPRRTSATMTYR